MVQEMKIFDFIHWSAYLYTLFHGGKGEGLGYPYHRETNVSQLSCTDVKGTILVKVDEDDCSQHHADVCNGLEQCNYHTEDDCYSKSTVYYWCIPSSTIGNKCRKKSNRNFLKGPSGHIQNPFYPHPSDLQEHKSYNCWWYLQGGFVYEITLIEVSIDTDKNCKNHNRNILIIASGGKELFHGCLNRQSGRPLVTDGGNVSINYRIYDSFANTIHKGFWIYYKVISYTGDNPSTIDVDLPATHTTSEMSTSDGMMELDPGSAVGIALGAAIGGVLLVAILVLGLVFRKEIVRKFCKTNKKKPRPKSAISEAELEDNPLYEVEFPASNGSKKKNREHPYEEVKVTSTRSPISANSSGMYAEIPDGSLLGSEVIRKSQEGIGGHFYAEIPANEKQSKRGNKTPLKASQEDFYAVIPDKDKGDNAKDSKPLETPVGETTKKEEKLDETDGKTSEKEIPVVEYAIVDLEKKRKERAEKRASVLEEEQAVTKKCDTEDESGDEK